MLPNLADLGVFQLSKEDRLRLVRAILESVIAEQPDIGLTAAQLAELDRRVAQSDEHPEDAIPWEEVERNLLARQKK